MAFTPDGARAYVTEELGGSVSVVDARAHRVIERIRIPRVGSGPTPPRPMGVRVIGFVAVFVVGGLTGVMLGAVPIDLQVHDTFFVVAHLRYLLIGGAVFPLLGGVHHWLPKMTGRMPSERLGHLAFGLVFVGFNLTFFPMHSLGLMGMTRRIYTYVPESGFAPLNLVATIGAFVLGLGVLVYLVNVVYNVRRGVPAGDDPWEADTLEWATSSPPPPYNFALLPTVQGRYALWERAEDAPVVTGLAPDRPEVLITNLLDAAPDHRTELPGFSSARGLTTTAIAACALLAPALAHAHPEHELRAAEVIRWWSWDPLVLVAVAVSAILYARGVRALWRSAGVGHGVRRWEALAFAAGLFAIVVALISPLAALSEILLSAHMSQHEALMLIAAPLAVLGRPLVAFLWALDPDRRERVGRWAQRPRVLDRPGGAPRPALGGGP